MTCFFFTRTISFFSSWAIRVINRLSAFNPHEIFSRCPLFSFIWKCHNQFQFIAVLITCSSLYLRVCNKAPRITPEIEISFEVLLNGPDVIAILLNICKIVYAAHDFHLDFLTKCSLSQFEKSRSVTSVINRRIISSALGFFPTIVPSRSPDT